MPRVTSPPVGPSPRPQALEERLNDKKEQLLEKELILEEITSLSDKLRVQAAEGRADTLELAQRVNEYQSKLRAVTRKIMATVSELSMYQVCGGEVNSEPIPVGNCKCCQWKRQPRMRATLRHHG
jgi:hypothetical protein